MLTLAQIGAIVIGASLAAAWDLRTRRIPNWLTGATAAAGLSIWIWQLGADGLVPWISGLAVGGALLLIPYVMGGIGAGDVKLIASLGAIGGVLFALHAGLAAALIGGLVAIGVMLARRGRGQPVRRMTFAYGPAIAGGALTALVWPLTAWSRLAHTERAGRRWSRWRWLFPWC